MDKKSLIGLGLIAAILGVWLYFSGPSKEQIERNKRIRDSVELANKVREEAEAAKIAATQKTADTVKNPVIVSDSIKEAQLNQTYRDFSVATKGTPETFVIENENLKAWVSNKGGQNKAYNAVADAMFFESFDGFGHSAFAAGCTESQ